MRRFHKSCLRFIFRGSGSVRETTHAMALTYVFTKGLELLIEGTIKKYFYIR